MGGKEQLLPRGRTGNDACFCARGRSLGGSVQVLARLVVRLLLRSRQVSKFPSQPHHDTNLEERQKLVTRCERIQKLLSFVDLTCRKAHGEGPSFAPFHVFHASQSKSIWLQAHFLAHKTNPWARQKNQRVKIKLQGVFIGRTKIFQRKRRFGDERATPPRFRRVGRPRRRWRRRPRRVVALSSAPGA